MDAIRSTITIIFLTRRYCGRTLDSLACVKKDALSCHTCTSILPGYESWSSLNSFSSTHIHKVSTRLLDLCCLLSNHLVKVTSLGGKTIVQGVLIIVMLTSAQLTVATSHSRMTMDAIRWRRELKTTCRATERTENKPSCRRGSTTDKVQKTT